MKKAAILIALITLAGFSEARVQSVSTTLAGGPFVVDVTSQSATIAWLVQSDGVTILPPDGGPVIHSPVFHVEKTSLTGLKPNTHYDYNLASLGEHGKGSFKTPPFGATGPFTFVVYGDNRTRPEVHQRVISQLLKNATPDFVLQTGDMVANGDDSAQWAEFFSIEKNLLRLASFFPTLGNHERNTRYFGEFFQKRDRYYSFDWGNAHFTVLDSDLLPDSADWNEEVKWLEADLKQHQGTAFRFVAAHHPPMTAVARRQEDNAHMKALISMFEKYHVSAGLFGHDHNYQHYSRQGIHYVTTGGGGAPLYDVDMPPPEQITQKVISI